MKIPSSSFYYKKKERSEEYQKKLLREKIEQIICDFPGYGYRRVTKQLQRDSIAINHKKTLRLMRKYGLLCKRKRNYKRTTNSNHKFPRYPNLIKDIIPTVPNQIWVSDITYVRIQSGFLYLAVILDLFSRKVIGYGITSSLESELTISALNMAISERNPLPGCTHHSDQGTQYANIDYVNLLKEHKFQISMASRGNPYENAHAESFIKTIKYEEVYLWDYRTVEEVMDRLPFFIKEVYNKKRLHSSLGYLPPEEFEANFFVKEHILPCQSLTY